MRYACITLCLFISCLLHAQGIDSLPPAKNTSSSSAFVTFDPLPQLKVIPVFTADARSHRLQLLKDLNSAGYVGSLGGQFPIVNINALGKTLQFGIAGTVYTTLNRYVGRGRVVNVDYFVDLLFDLELTQRWKLRGGFGHTSQHLSDDAIETGLTARNYVKDYMQLQTVHQLIKNRLLVYGGLYYFHNFKLTNNNLPENLSHKVMIQAGFEADVVKLTKATSFYIGADIKLRQEFDFGNTHSLQAGFKLSGPTQRKLRFAYNYLGGYEERGQFYNTHISLNTVGLYFDF